MHLKDIKFERLFSMENEGFDDEEEILVAIRLHAKALHAAVERFFSSEFILNSKSLLSLVQS